MPTTRRIAVEGGARIALQRFGQGETHVVFVPGFVSHVELQWADPAYARFLATLSRVATVTMYDKRGAGMSDPVHPAPTLEQHVRDLTAVIDDTGAERVVLLGFSNGGTIAISYAAAHPEKLIGLALCSTFARVEGLHELMDRVDETARTYLDRWGQGVGIELAAPSLASSKLAQRNYSVFEQASLHKDMAIAMADETRKWDVSAALPQITTPTLVLHRRGDYVPIEAGAEVAKRIAGARFIELEGGDHVPYLGDSGSILSALEGFIRAVSDNPAPPRPVRTVLFTDLVGSTESAVRVGDEQWRHKREAHDALTRAEIERHNGEAIKSTGDGWLATFVEAPDALRAASAIIQQVGRTGLEVRAGAHTGELDVLDDGDVSGLTVNTAARVAALAGAGEILLTEAVRGRLVAAVEVTPWGVAELKGLPGGWTLFRIDGELDDRLVAERNDVWAPTPNAATRVVASLGRNVLGRGRARLLGATSS